MNQVTDRNVQYPRRYTLTQAGTGVVLGTFDFNPVTGEVIAEGTPINAELFNSIANSLEVNGTTIKLKDSSGNDISAVVMYTIEETQSNSTTKMPCSKILQDSSFKRVYRSIDQLNGINTSSTMADVVTVMGELSILVTDISLSSYTNLKTGLISGYPSNGIMTIQTDVYNNATMYFYSKEDYVPIVNPMPVYCMYNGFLKWNNNKHWSGWKQVLTSPDSIETTQSTSELKVPSSNLLRKSSFARVYRSFADLGIPNSSTIAELHSAMIDRSRAIISVSTYAHVSYGNTGLELPNNLFYVLEAIRSDNERLTLKLVGKASNSTVLYQYEGMYWNYGDTNKFTGWKQIIDKSYVDAPTSNIILTKTNPTYLLKNTAITVGTPPDVDTYNSAIGWTDNANNNCSYIQYACRLSGSVTSKWVINSYNKPNVRETGVALEQTKGNTAADDIRRFYPISNTNCDLGTSANKWKDIYFSGALLKNGVDVVGALSNPNILTNADFLVNDLGEASYTSPSTTTINNWGFGTASGVTGSYTVTTKKLKCDYSPINSGGKFVNLYQYIPNPTQFNGKTITFSARAISTTGNWLIQLWRTPSGGSTTNLGPTSVIDSSLSKSITVNVGATDIAPTDTVRVLVQSYSETVLDYAKLEIGSLATAFSPAPNTMLITASPTSDSMAVNKLHVDNEKDELQTMLNNLLARIAILEDSGEKIYFTKSSFATISATQDGVAVTSGFTGVSSKTVVITLTKPASNEYFLFSFTGWKKDGVAITSGSDGFTIATSGVTQTLTFTYGTGKGGTYQGNVSKKPNSGEIV